MTHGCFVDLTGYGLGQNGIRIDHAGDPRDDASASMCAWRRLSDPLGLGSPARRQQNCRNQQESAERQPHPSLGQAAGERDASGDRRDAAKCERQSDKPIDPTGPGIRQQRQERASGGATKAPPTPNKPENTPPISPTTVVQPQARVGPVPTLTLPRRKQ